MDWIFDHLQILIAAGAGIAYWLNQRKKQQEEGESEEATAQAFDSPEAAADAARARRVRDEIRRKIASRQGGLQESPGGAPPLFDRPFEDAAPREAPPRVEWRAEPTRQVGPSAAELAVLARQRRLGEQLKALERTSASATPKAARVLSRGRSAPAIAIGAQSVADDLRSAASIRRAIVLREVLGPPLALR